MDDEALPDGTPGRDELLYLHAALNRGEPWPHYVEAWSEGDAESGPGYGSANWRWRWE